MNRQEALEACAAHVHAVFLRHAPIFDPDFDGVELGSWSDMPEEARADNLKTLEAILKDPTKPPPLGPIPDITDETSEEDKRRIASRVLHNKSVTLMYGVTLRTARALGLL